MKRILMFVVAMATLTACCGECDKPKFNAKEYAERKTERLDKIVDLTDAQEKEVYATYLAQGKEIKKNIKAAKKMCGEMKRPDCAPKPECQKAECDKAKCDKAECQKAECDKAKCDKKAECDKAKCDKKAECCKKAECDKAKCDKKAECKPQHKERRHPNFVTHEMRKATFAKISKILTPEQYAKLKAHQAKRHNCRPEGKKCMPTPACAPAEK